MRNSGEYNRKKVFSSTLVLSIFRWSLPTIETDLRSVWLKLDNSNTRNAGHIWRNSALRKICFPAIAIGILVITGHLISGNDFDNTLHDLRCLTADQVSSVAVSRGTYLDRPVLELTSPEEIRILLEGFKHCKALRLNPMSSTHKVTIAIYPQEIFLRLGLPDNQSEIVLGEVGRFQGDTRYTPLGTFESAELFSWYGQMVKEYNVRR